MAAEKRVVEQDHEVEDALAEVLDQIVAECDLEENDVRVVEGVEEVLSLLQQLAGVFDLADVQVDQEAAAHVKPDEAPPLVGKRFENVEKLDLRITF